MCFEFESDPQFLGNDLPEKKADPPRFQQMLIKLQEYDMVIKNRPGKWNIQSSQQNKEVIDLDVKVDFRQFSTEKLTHIRDATNADPILCELYGFFKARFSLLRMAFCLKETGY